MLCLLNVLGIECGVCTVCFVYVARFVMLLIRFVCCVLFCVVYCGVSCVVYCMCLVYVVFVL